MRSFLNLSKIVNCRTFNRKASCIAFYKSVKAVDIFGVWCGYCCLHRQEYIYSKPAVKRPVGSVIHICRKKRHNSPAYL
nr:MAG TPA: Thioredoxin-like domain [Caudoviricetes sp.]